MHIYSYHLSHSISFFKEQVTSILAVSPKKIITIAIRAFQILALAYGAYWFYQKSRQYRLQELANNHFREDRYEEAEALYKRLLKADPQNARIIQKYVELLERQRRQDESETLLASILGKKVTAQLLFLYTQLLYQHEKYEAAQQAILTLLDIQPRNAILLAWYARILIHLRQWGEAQATAGKAFAIAPHDSDVLRVLVEVKESYIHRAMIPHILATLPPDPNNGSCAT